METSTALVLGLDLGGTNIKAALVGHADELIDATSMLPTGAIDGPLSVVARLVEAARAVTDAADIALLDCCGVGVAVPGSFDPAAGTVRSLPNLPGWEGFELSDMLSTELGLPVSLANDGQAFTFAEALIGAGVGAAVVAGVTLGTGIGGGIVIDGNLHTGPSGTAGEFGHQTISSDGPLCGCGRRGCLEALASPPRVAEAAGHDDFEQTIRAFRNGEPRASAAVEDMFEYLGTGLANIVTMLGPDRIVIGGGAARAGGSLIDGIRASTVRHAPFANDTDIDIVATSLGQRAGAVGAALTARHGSRISP